MYELKAVKHEPWCTFVQRDQSWGNKCHKATRIFHLILTKYDQVYSVQCLFSKGPIDAQSDIIKLR